MSWLPASAPGRTSLDRVFGLQPELYARYQEFAELFWRLRPVDPVLLELCRLRVAALLGCARELELRRPEAAALDEEKISALDDWPRSPRFSPVERACLAFAEKFVLEPHGLSDEHAAAVAAHLTAAEMVAFTEALALFDGFARFQILLGVAPEGAPGTRSS
jgi:alkylhydroperoxidase family enzyme